MRDILLINYIAEDTALDVIENKKEALLTRLSNRFIKEAEETVREDLSKDIESLVKENKENLVAIGSHGVFGALWDLADEAKCGIKVDISDILIRQEVVEILDILDINPYVVSSKNSFLLLVENGYALERSLRENNITSKVIGVETNNNDRIVINGEETRFLTPNTRATYFTS